MVGLLSIPTSARTADRTIRMRRSLSGINVAALHLRKEATHALAVIGRCLPAMGSISPDGVRSQTRADK
jgi:hypothetical protein